MSTRYETTIGAPGKHACCSSIVNSASLRCKPHLLHCSTARSRRRAAAFKRGGGHHREGQRITREGYKRRRSVTGGSNFLEVKRNVTRTVLKIAHQGNCQIVYFTKRTLKLNDNKESCIFHPQN